MTIQNSNEPDKVVFSCKYAMIKDTTEFKKHLANWSKNEADSYSGKFNAYGSPQICLKSTIYFLNSTTNMVQEGETNTIFQLKYYPSRNFSIGIVKTGVDHIVEAGAETIDGLIRKIFGKDDIIYDMHTSNAEFYLKNKTKKCN